MKTLSVKNILEDTECSDLIKQINEALSQPETDIIKFQGAHEYISGEAIELKSQNGINGEIKERFIEVLKEINKAYNYELNDFKDVEFSLVKYSEGAYLPTHMDIMSSEENEYYLRLIKRKLILVTLLNDPNDFIGGELSINIDCKHKVNLTKGETVSFPAFFPHELSKITKGERYIMLTVVNGKYPFK